MSMSIGPTASSIDAMGEQYRAITQNLANASTVGYKAKRTAFSQVLRRSQAAVKASPFIDFTQGALVQTGRALDMAINGDGFFVVEGPNGPSYTRNGTFRPNASGQLVNDSGWLLQGESGPITIPTQAGDEDISIDPEGNILAMGLPVGKVKVVTFENMQVLVPAGGGAFSAPRNVEPEDAEESSVIQGHQEASNVSTVEELVGLITVTRMYEANSKTITAQDDKLKSLLSVAMA